MKKHVISALLGFALCLATATATATAAPPLTITDSGFYLTVITEKGVPTLVEVETVIDLRSTDEGPTDPETSPPPTLDPPPEGIALDVAEWASEIDDPAGAQRYALIFEATRDAVRDGSLKVAGTFRVLRISADEHLSDTWESFRDRLSEHFTEKQAAGLLSTPEQMQRTLELIRYGLEYSADGSSRIPLREQVAVVATVQSLVDSNTGI